MNSSKFIDEFVNEIKKSWSPIEQMYISIQILISILENSGQSKHEPMLMNMLLGVLSDLEVKKGVR